MSKAGTHDKWPPLREVLRDIANVQGQYRNKEPQQEFLKSLLDIDYGDDANERARRVQRFRQYLNDCIRGKTIKKPHTKTYKVTDIFNSGPCSVLVPEFLDDIGYHRSGESSEEPQSGEGDGKMLYPKDRPETAHLSKEKGAQSPSGTIKVEMPDTCQIPLNRQVAVDQQPMSANANHSALEKSQKRKIDPPINSPDDRSKTEKRPRLDGKGTVPATTSASNKRRQASLAETPTAASPTEQHVHQLVIEVPKDKPTLQRGMEQIEFCLTAATMSYFQQHRIDVKTSSIFVEDPSPKLRGLYETLVGPRVRWEAWSVDQYKSFTQDYTVIGLFGAFIFKDIFMGDTYWNIRDQLGDDAKYVQAAIKDVSPELDLRTILNAAAEKRVACPEFQRRKVAEHAQRRAGSLVLILRPHLEALKRKEGPDDEYTNAAPSDRSWIALLEEAFHYAIIAKQWMLHSSRGPFDYHWPAAGKPIELERQRTTSELLGGERVLHAILPYVATIANDERTVFCRALVVPSLPHR